MDQLETQRNGIEKKMFAKAISELGLIVTQTLAELEANIETEMMPFYVASKNNMADVKSAVQKAGASLARFTELDSNSDFQTKFPFIAY